MSNFDEIINKIFSNGKNRKRKILGINTVDIEKYSKPYNPFKLNNKVLPINDKFKLAFNKCLPLYLKCTKSPICNKMLDLYQQIIVNNYHMNNTEFEFYYLNKNNLDYNEIINCLVPNIMTYKTYDNMHKLNDTNNNVDYNNIDYNSTNYYTTNYTTNNLNKNYNLYDKILFINQTEFDNMKTEYLYKIISLDKFDGLLTISDIINSGYKDITKTSDWLTTTVFTIIGGKYDNNSFYNKIIEVPIFDNINDLKNPKFKFYRFNKVTVNNDYISINDLFKSGMKSFTLNDQTLINNEWNISTKWRIIGGTYNNYTFDNKIDEVIKKGLVCNLLYKVPYIGIKVCSLDNKKILTIIGIFFLIIILIIFFIFNKKKILN